MSKRPRCLHVLAGVVLASGIAAPSAPVLLGVGPVQSPPPAASGRSIPSGPEQNTLSPGEGRTSPPVPTKPAGTQPEAPATPATK